MKKIVHVITCGFIVFATLAGKAQVGIGTLTPAASAQLEVNSLSKGFLPPRVALTATNSPNPITSPATGLLVYNTATAGDVTPGYYYYSGSAWLRLTIPSDNAANVTGTVVVANGGTGATTLTGVLIGNGTSAVTSVNPGSNGNVLASNGTTWVSAAAPVPAGVVSSFAGNAAPTGYLFCDGSAVSRTTYANLFNAIGTTYGTGDGSTTFNLPDLRGRAIFGLDNMGGSAAGRLTTSGGISANNSIGANGGAQTITLSTTNMPSHTHTFSGTSVSTSSDAHSHTYFDAYYAENFSTGGVGGSLFGIGAGSDFDNKFYWRTSIDSYSQSKSPISTSSDAHLHTVTAAGTISSTGSGSAFQHLPPAIVLNYIIKF